MVKASQGDLDGRVQGQRQDNEEKVVRFETVTETEEMRPTEPTDITAHVQTQ